MIKLGLLKRSVDRIERQYCTCSPEQRRECLREPGCDVHDIVFAMVELMGAVYFKGEADGYVRGLKEIKKLR